MNILEYADTLNLEINITRYPCQDNRWTAHFHAVEVRIGGAGLLGAYGNGKSPEEAIKDYLTKIIGQKIILHAMSPDLRREYIVPNTLTGIPENA